MAPSSVEATYRLKDRIRLRMIPRRPPSPYMIEMVSMKTFRAREPDHSAIRKPIEIRSGRPPPSTSSSVGVMTFFTLLAVSTCPESSMIRSCTVATVSAPSHSSR